MPEGDTVWRTARRLDRALSGSLLVASDFRIPSLATVDLTGQTVHETVSRGKHLLTRIGDLTLHTHLKMEGRWIFDQRATHETRVILRTATTTALGCSVLVDLVPTSEEAGLVGHLGPDLLGDDWDARLAVANLLRDPDRTLADALLDQRNLAGIGNVYKCELAFLAGLDPRTPMRDVPDVARLVGRARLLLEANKDRVTRVITGRKREPTWVYGRHTCLRCGSRTRKEDLGPSVQERVTYWCPSCQPSTEGPTHGGSG